MPLSTRQKRRVQQTLAETNPGPLRYIQYVRRSSSKGSRKQEHSIASQKNDLLKLEEQLGLHVIDRLEESRSAKEPGRPVFNEMIQRIRSGEVNAILCWHWDRLTRNEEDSGTLRWLLRNRIIREIRTPTRTYLPGDSAVLTAVESAIGEQFIPDHIAKVQLGMLEKCARGGVPFYVPEGYLNDKLTRTAKADPLRFPLIRKAFQLILTESCSVSEAHRVLHQEWGYRKREKRNSTSSEINVGGVFYKLLANPFYCGYFTWQGQVYLHDLPRAVTKEEFDRVQAVLRKRGYKKTKKYIFAYTGLIHCASCGYAATAEVSKGYTYYHCANRLRTCTKKGVREEVLDQKINSLLESIQMPAEIEEFATAVLDELSSEQREIDHAKADSRNQTLQSLKTQRERLLSLYLQGHIEPEEYAERKYDLAEQEARLLLDEEQAGLEWQIVDETVANALRFASHTRSAFQAAEPLLRRFAARQIGDEFILNNGQLRVTLHPKFEMLRRWRQEDRRDTPSKPDGGGKVRTWSQNGGGQNRKFEPSPTPILNLVGSKDDPNFLLWWTRLHEYRTLVRERNWIVPKVEGFTATENISASSGGARRGACSS